VRMAAPRAERSGSPLRRGRDEQEHKMQFLDLARCVATLVCLGLAIVAPFRTEAADESFRVPASLASRPC
jgi:hypothetical protein